MTGRIEIPYGPTSIEIDLPECALCTPRTIDDTRAADAEQILRAALARPIGSAPLRSFPLADRRVVIITSDASRPCPTNRMLPLVLSELRAAGVADKDIVIVVATGVHAPLDDDSLRDLVGGDVFGQVRTISHDPDNTTSLGVSSAGTPVEIFAPVVAADLRVCLGLIDFHYFAGFSGGAKAVFPGCGSRAAIRANHRMMFDPLARSGRLEDNPVRRDIEEVAARASPTFILNALVDTGNRVFGAVAGDVVAAHRAGCAALSERGTVEIRDPADLVVVGGGGHPRDLTLYQAQKALNNASFAVRSGGIIVWLADCSQGFGDAVFERWLTEPSRPGELLERIAGEFLLGGHKAAALDLVRAKAKVFLVSSLPPEMVRRCGLHPYSIPQQAANAALDLLGPTAKILVIPDGFSVLPRVASSWGQ